MRSSRRYGPNVSVGSPDDGDGEWPGASVLMGRSPDRGAAEEVERAVGALLREVDPPGVKVTESMCDRGV
ncbi:hypothetical protein Acsp06_30570 [Actinomycetospora sp. NBRC 106375]|nr:hypothetical protein Acsp06_30570 [Actinomycetospora sp. NBRC 106375]